MFYFLVFIVTLAWLALLTALCMTLGLWVLPLIMLAVIAMFSVICGRDQVNHHPLNKRPLRPTNKALTTLRSTQSVLMPGVDLSTTASAVRQAP